MRPSHRRAVVLLWHGPWRGIRAGDGEKSV